MIVKYILDIKKTKCIFFKKDNFFLNMRSRKRGKYKTLAIKNITFLSIMGCITSTNIRFDIFHISNDYLQ